MLCLLYVINFSLLMTLLHEAYIIQFIFYVFTSSCTLHVSNYFSLCSHIHKEYELTDLETCGKWPKFKS